MKKKTLLLTTLAGTMLVAGMTGTSVKAAVSEGTKATISEDTNSALVELVSSTDVLTTADVKALVEARYASKGVKVTATVEGETAGTGTKVNLSNGKTLTLVVYGDLDGDGEVGPYDLDTLSQVLVGKAELSDATKVAGDIADNEEIDPMDLDVMSQFLVGKSAVVETGKVLPETINVDMGIKVKVETTYTGTNGLWAVEPTTDNTEVTLKVESAENQTTSFELTGIPTGATLTSGEGVTVGTVTDGKVTVTVPRTAGNYKLTVTNNGATYVLTIHVMDTTDGGDFTVLHLYDTSDMNQLDTTVSENLKDETVGFQEPNKLPIKTGKGNGNITYTMNINNLKESTINKTEGKYFAIKVKLEKEYKLGNENLRAVDNVTGEEYYMTEVDGEANTFFVYLDASRKGDVTLTLQNVNSPKAQVTSNNAKSIVIKVKTTSVLGVDANMDESDRTVSIATFKDGQITNDAVRTNQNIIKKKVQQTPIIATVEINTTKYNTLDLYTKTDLLKEYSFTYNSKEYAKAKWIGITAIVLGMDANVSSDQVIVSDYDKENVVVVDTMYGLDTDENPVEGKFADNFNSVDSLAIWLKVPDYAKLGKDEYTYTIHLKYNVGNVTEECDLTINMHNSETVYIKSIEPAEDDEITKSVMSKNYTFKETDLTPFYSKTGKYDTVSVGINYQALGTDKRNPLQPDVEGKWIKLKVTYNVPYDRVLTGIQDTQPGDIKNEEFINKDKLNDGYSEYVWFDLSSDETITATKCLVNAWGTNSTDETLLANGVVGGFTNDNYTYVTLTLEDTSALKTAQVNHLSGYRNMVERSTVYDHFNKTSLTALNGSWAPNEIADAMQTYHCNYSANTLVVHNYGNMKVYGKEGKWALAYLYVGKETAKDIYVIDDETTTTIDETNAYVLDYANAEAAFGKVRDGEYDVLPVWINLNAVCDTENGELKGDNDIEKSLTLTLGLKHEGKADEKLNVSFTLVYDPDNTYMASKGQQGFVW